MKDKEIIKLILDELGKAEEKFNWWPKDIVHASAILNEGAGELTRASLDFSYSRANIENCIKEATQVGAMTIRFLRNIKNYERIHNLQIKDVE